MKKSQKLLTAFLFISAWAIALNGCSGTNVNVNVDEAINKALSAAQDVHNYEAQVRIEIGMDNQGQKLDIPSTVDLIAFDEPYKVKMLATSEATPSLASESYVIKQENLLLTYTKNKDKWERREAQIDQAPGYIQSDLIWLYLENINNFKYIETERIDGRKVYKLQGTIGGESLTHAINSISVLPGNFFPDANTINTVVDNLEPVSIEIWIDKETFYPVQYKMDMATTITRILEETNSPLANTISFSKASVSMTLKNINKATPFEIPQEALATNPL